MTQSTYEQNAITPQYGAALEHEAIEVNEENISDDVELDENGDGQMERLTALVNADVAENDNGHEHEPLCELIWHDGAISIAFPSGTKLNAAPALSPAADVDASLQFVVDDLERYNQAVRSHPSNISIHKLAPQAKPGKEVAWLLTLPVSEEGTEEDATKVEFCFDCAITAYEDAGLDDLALLYAEGAEKEYHANQWMPKAVRNEIVKNHGFLNKPLKNHGFLNEFC